MEKLKIALFATNLYPTPPKGQKVIYAPLWLTYELAKGLRDKGHEVFLFGSKGSHFKDNLISLDMPQLQKNKPLYNALLKSKPSWKTVISLNYEFVMMSELFKMAQNNAFDIIHLMNSRPSALPFCNLVKTPVLFTIHSPFDHPPETNALKLIYKEYQRFPYSNVHYVSISNAQRKPLQRLNYIKTIYNGVDTKVFSFKKNKKGFLFFAGRIIPQKGVDIAIRVAKATKSKLKIAGYKPNDQDEYWKKQIEPHLSDKITYEGMLGAKTLKTFYKNAKAVLVPSLCYESFGLVAAEAMSCGTPVIAFKKGGLREVVKHNETGFLVKNEAEMIKAVKKINKIDPFKCRQRVLDKFSVETMVNEYEATYHEAIQKQQQ